MAGSNNYGVELIGQRAVIRMLAEAESNTVPLLGRALYEEGQLIFRKSQKQAPFRLGTLKSSGRLTEPETIGNSVQVTVGYGGAASKYAEYVHNNENLRFRNGKKALYVADPLWEARDRMDDRILKRISKIVKP